MALKPAWMSVPSLNQFVDQLIQRKQLFLCSCLTICGAQPSCDVLIFLYILFSCCLYGGSGLNCMYGYHVQTSAQVWSVQIDRSHKRTHRTSPWIKKQSSARTVLLLLPAVTEASLPHHRGRQLSRLAFHPTVLMRLCSFYVVVSDLNLILNLTLISASVFFVKKNFF